MKRIICLIMLISVLFSSTSCKTIQTIGSYQMLEETDETMEDGINYMVLVNKTNPLPEGWEAMLETVKVINSVGDEVEVETRAYDAYLELKSDLEKNDDIHIELDSACRSVEQQQQIMEEFTEKYGADYAAMTVAVPGYSEHHTGLALDLYLIVDGQEIYYNEDLIRYPQIWKKIQTKAANYGFILRYLEGKEHITGYAYEPWHLRYIDDVGEALKIMKEGSTLEEYLGAVPIYEPEIHIGSSVIFTRKELEDAAIQIKCYFAYWSGCQLDTLTYAGDEAATAKNLEWINNFSEGNSYVQCCKFLMDFQTLEDAGVALSPNTSFKDYEWWLGRTAEGGWEIVSFGY